MSSVETGPISYLGGNAFGGSMMYQLVFLQGGDRDGANCLAVLNNENIVQKLSQMRPYERRGPGRSRTIVGAGLWPVRPWVPDAVEHLTLAALNMSLNEPHRR